MKRENFRRDCQILAGARRGVIMLWMLLAIPALLFLLGMTVDLSRVWMARVQLRSATDAAALSAAKTWGEGKSQDEARGDAIEAGGANFVAGLSAPFALENSDITFGRVHSTNIPVAFQANQDPADPGYVHAVLVQKTVAVSSVWGNWLLSSGAYNVSMVSVAIYDSTPEPPPPRIASVQQY